MSDIREFYSGKNILISGATGYVGKCLVEKLLRSCESIGILYLLFRCKKGDSVEQRYEKFLNNTVCDPLQFFINLRNTTFIL